MKKTHKIIIFSALATAAFAAAGNIAMAFGVNAVSYVTAGLVFAGFTLGSIITEALNNQEA